MTGPSPLRVRVEQIAPARRKVDENRRSMEARIADAASDGVDVVVFPELSLTGYALGHRVGDVATELGDEPPVTVPESGPVTFLGLVERGEDRLLYNTGVAVGAEGVLHVHRKIHLPTYGMFEEGRLFAPGRRGVTCFGVAPGWRTTLLVCEDLWHPSLVYLGALQGADLVVVLSAAAGRGRPAPEEEHRPLFASTRTWELLARTAGVLHGVWVVVANRAGVEDGISFAGESLVVDPRGIVRARGVQGEEDRLDVTLDPGAVERARRGFSHLGDEDPALVAREIRRILREREGWPDPEDGP